MEGTGCGGSVQRGRHADLAAGRYLLVHGYWGRPAIDYLWALPVGATVLVREHLIYGYAAAWCATNRPDLVVRAATRLPTHCQSGAARAVGGVD